MQQQHHVKRIDLSAFTLTDPFGALMEALPDGVLIADSDGTIAFVNGRLEDLSGYRRSELLGRPVEMLVPERVQPVHERNRARYHDDAGLRPMGTGLDIRLRRRDGVEVPVDIQLSPVELGGSTVTVAAVRDIAPRKRAEEAIRESEERLAVVGDRERIARLLTDQVIGSVFGIGLALQAMATASTDDVGRSRMEELVTDLDRIIEDLRGAVFGLRS